MYDSATDCWKKTCILPPGFYRWHHGILCNGFLYSRRFQFDGLVAYDMEQGVWSQIQAPMPHAFDYHALVECQGRIFTIGGQLKNDITKRICILQLERTKLEWVEVSVRGIIPNLGFTRTCIGVCLRIISYMLFAYDHYITDSKRFQHCHKILSR